MFTTDSKVSGPPQHPTRPQGRIRKAGVLSLSLLALIPVTVVAMDLLRFCPFSSVEGRVVRNGVPVPDAVIERGYSFDADKYTVDKTTTDVNGYFKLGSIHRFSLSTLGPFELNVYQKIWIKLGSEQYEAWRLTKRRPLDVDSELPNEGEGVKFDPNTPFDKKAEYPKRKIRLLCDLAQPAAWKEPRFGRNELYGICNVVPAL